jgi:hypothetical protein
MFSSKFLTRYVVLCCVVLCCVVLCCVVLCCVVLCCDSCAQCALRYYFILERCSSMGVTRGGVVTIP